RGVRNARFEDADVLWAYASIDQDHAIVFFFAGVGQAELFHRCPRVKRLGQPNFFRIALAIDFGGSQGAIGKSTAQHDDSAGFLEWIFSNEPSAGMTEGVNTH